MLICHDINSICRHDRLLICLEQGLNEEARSYLQDIEKFCNATDASGSTLLHYSVKYGNVEMTQYLINEGCNIDARDGDGVTPLMLAVKNKDVATTQLLLKNDADIYETDYQGTSILRISLDARLSSPRFPLNQNSEQILEMLFDRINRDFSLHNHRLVVLLLCANNIEKLAVVVFGNRNLIKLMINIRYPVNFYEPKFNYTGLHCAILFAKCDSAKILIDHGANVGAVDKTGHSVLDYYTTNFQDVDKNCEILKVLLKNSVRLSIRDRSGLTEMERLLICGKKKTLTTILKSGIDVSAHVKKSLLSILIWNRNQDILDVFTETNIKFDVNETGEESFLMIAAQRRSPKMVQFLLEHGADVNLKSTYGSPLLYATTKDRIILDLTIRYPDDDESNDAKVTELLLQYGADAQFFVEDRKTYLADILFDQHREKLYTKVIVAHLALLGSLEPPVLKDQIRQKIEYSEPLKTYFDLCTQQLKWMKQFELCETMTLFNILSEREDNYSYFVGYARDHETKAALNKAVKNLSGLEPYYVNTLEKRLSKVLNEAQLQETVSRAIGELMGLCPDVYHVIIYKIMSYLKSEDLQNLSKIDRILCRVN